MASSLDIVARLALLPALLTGNPIYAMSLTASIAALAGATPFLIRGSAAVGVPLSVLMQPFKTLTAIVLIVAALLLAHSRHEYLAVALLVTGVFASTPVLRHSLATLKSRQLIRGA